VINTWEANNGAVRTIWERERCICWCKVVLSCWDSVDQMIPIHALSTSPLAEGSI
jgi:hypothetical protein